ncbi:MAG: trimethylamine corrinoid protein 2 [Firmicutes bacterium]|nr:trimethylamine corrinoid protein 2 [Bacillota bacterium]
MNKLICEEIFQRFHAWWKHEETERPMMRIIARKKEPIGSLENLSYFNDPQALHVNPEYRVGLVRNQLKTHTFYAEAFPYVNLNMGAGSMAVYLGCNPVFSNHTIWIEPLKVETFSHFDSLKYDGNNYWWKLHQEALQKAVELADDEFYIAIPDIIEGLDILSSLRGANNLCFDIMDEPDAVKRRLDEINQLYYKYYDRVYDIVKKADGSACYTAFSILAQGRVAKIQCDFSAMISPVQFRDFALTHLKEQCKNLDYTVYHLDGTDAICHLDAILEMEQLNALQWTPGAGKEDGGNEMWYPIYDKTVAAGKGLWISLSGSSDVMFEKAKRLIRRYGAKWLYLVFEPTDEDGAKKLLKLN